MRPPPWGVGLLVMVAATALDLSSQVRGEQVDGWTVLWLLGVTAAVGAGLAVWRERPDSWMGALMVAWLLPGMISDLNIGYLNTLTQTTTFLSYMLGAPLFVAMVFAYPSGRIIGGAYWLFLVTFAVVAEAFLLPAALYQSPDAECPRCLSTYLYVGPAPFDVRLFVQIHAALVLFVMVPWFCWLVARRVRSLSRGARRTAVPFYYGAAAPVVVWVAENVVRLLDVRTWWDALGTASTVALLAVPILFAWGVLGTRRRRTPAVADLVVELGHVAPGGVRDALARTLGDPSLTIALWLPDRGTWVDDSGRPVTLPSTPDRTVTLIGDGLAAVVHDPDLVDQLSLVTAAGSAARLALENERLHADQLAQIEELRRSRARITSAADQERRRIERDLHDGAQQRLVGAGLALQMAQSRVPDGEATELLVAAQAEVAMAVRELRELARGVYPAVLLDQGLAAALQTLADRSTVPVTVDFPSSRLPGQVEAAAYFIAAEAVTNIGKHAHATAATVTGDVTGDVLRLTIVDDGVGGACAGDGSGLQGLADRAGALGGSVTVTSPVGRGTTIEAVLPCASS